MPLTSKLAADWFVDHLLAAGVELEYWDITELLRGEVVEHHRISADYVREICDEVKLEEAVSDRQDAVFVLLIPKIWKFRRIFRLLTQKRCRTVVFMWGALPAFNAISSDSVLRVLLSPNALFEKLKNRLFALLLSRRWYTRPNDLVFAAGRVMLNKPVSARKIIPIAHFDFDKFIPVKSNDRLIEGRYAVFLDNYLPFHSDRELLGMPQINSKLYYDELNHFFTALERRHGLRVVIAAHPKSHYHNDEFRGRLVSIGHTLELTSNAELVLFHASTSVSYAILAKKPVWAIFTDEMERLLPNSYMPLVRAMSDYLDAPLINISDLNENLITNLGVPNSIRFEEYVRDFLVTDEIDIGQSKEIVLREIQGLYV